MTAKPARGLCLLTLGLLVSAIGCGKPPDTPLADESSLSVTTALGEVRGVSEPGIRVFRGIPYAAPPVGPLRWRPPQPAARWEGVRVAEDFGSACPQLQAPEPVSEDCLSLNVWTPASATSASRLPVMVFVHGGGFRGGSGARPVSHGDTFAREGVIQVTLNYRLGALGFLAHPLLETEQAGEPRGNYGVLDMVAALEWVKRNIDAFGGDPAKVTLFGHSAGGMAVQLLMVVPQAEGLFARAISMSGYGTWALPRVRTASSDVAPEGAPTAEKIGAKIVERAAEGANIETAAALRAIPAARLAEAVRHLHLPLVDGIIVPEEPGIVFSRGDQHDVPFISGGTSFDGTSFRGSGMTVQEFLESWGPRLPEVRSLYEADFAVSDQQGAVRLFGDARYLLAARTLVRDMARVSSPGRVYYYSFVPAALRSREPGARHGAGTGPLFGRATDEGAGEVGRVMRTCWLNFARNGDPNGPGLAEWPEHDASSDLWLVLDETTVAKPSVSASRLHFLEKQYLARVGRTGP